MKTPTLILCLLGLSLGLQAQYSIGSMNLSLTDTSRSNRTIPLEIYYPATTAGANTPPASGSFPVLTLGHGFVMSIDAYYHIRDYYVPRGYILALVNTETSFSPSHLEFAKDLLYTNNELRRRCTSDGSFLLYGHHLGTTAIMGHSMGGGATVLAGSLAAPGDVTTIIGLAPAGTNPSAVTAAGNVTIPALVFSGDGDMVTPPAQHQLPIYNGLASSCKIYISVIGGGHCYFARSNIACDFGETASGSTISITRDEQHDAMNTFLLPWLEIQLKGNSSEVARLTDSLNTSPRVNVTNACSTLSAAPVPGNQPTWTWGAIMPGERLLQLDLTAAGEWEFSLTDMQGKVHHHFSRTLPAGASTLSIPTAGLAPGMYFLSMRSASLGDTAKFVLP